MNCDNGVGTDCPVTSSEESSESNESNKSSSNECDSSGSSDSSDSSNSSDSKCNSLENGNGEPSICSGVADLEVRANPSECGSFYLCMLEIGLPVMCPPGLWFNPMLRTCVQPGSFCTSTLPCDNGVGGGCTDITTEDPIITPTHASVTITY